jgi:hypothetical protein
VGWNPRASAHELWKLGRTRALLDLAGRSHAALRAVLVAGTKGDACIVDLDPTHFVGGSRMATDQLSYTSRADTNQALATQLATKYPRDVILKKQRLGAMLGGH